MRAGRITDAAWTRRVLPALVLTLVAVLTASALPATDRTAAALSAVAGAARPAPPGPRFYIPPEPLPRGEPGDIVRWRPSDPGVFDEWVNAWQVMYLSTDALGQRNVVTGTVLVPENIDPATAGIVGFAPGTQGPAFRCAPSKMINSGTFYEQDALRHLLRAGYAVAVTDYEGYRPEPETTYVVGRSMGHALIDVVRAAQRLPAAGLSAEAKVVYRGYSQGGAAAMWAGQLQPEYAPGMNLVGVVGGGVPASLASVALALNGGRGFGLLLYSLVGLDNAYPDLDLEPFLNEAGRAAVARMRSEACILKLLLRYRGDRLSEYVTSSPLGTEKWLSRVTENQLGESPIEVPVYQYHAANDQLVPLGQARALRDRYCSMGVRLTWRLFETDHLTLVARGNDASLAFINARMAGEPAETTCPSPV